jgi:hypothetical protein
VSTCAYSTSKDISQSIKGTYKLDALLHNNGYIYVRINKGVYGLPQAGILALDYSSITLDPSPFCPRHRRLLHQMPLEVEEMLLEEEIPLEVEEMPLEEEIPLEGLALRV